MNFHLIKKNIITIITILVFIYAVVTIYCLFILLNSNTEISTLIQFLGVIVALMVGTITALLSWDNTQKVIENNEKQIMIVEKYELLLKLNIKLQSFKLHSKNEPYSIITNFNDEDYNNYLTLIYLQNILKNNKDVFMILFPKTLLNYTQFKFTFTENLNAVLPKNKCKRILIALFKEMFKKTKHDGSVSLELDQIAYPETISMAFSNLSWLDLIYKSDDENLEEYQKGIVLYFKELNKLIELFNKEFEEQKINYELF